MKAKNITRPMYFKRSKVRLKVKTNSDASIQYKSNNKRVRVNSKGVVTIPKNYHGTITIRIKVPKTQSCFAKAKRIKIRVKKPKFKYKSIWMYRGEKWKLPIKYASKKAHGFVTTKSSVATVSSKGTIYAKEPGTCYIKAKVGNQVIKTKLKVYRRSPNFDAPLWSYNTRNNYFKVKYYNKGAKTLYIKSGIKVRDNDYKQYDRRVYLKKQVKIKPGKTKYVKFYVKGSTTWPDVEDFTLYYYFKYDGKKYEGHSWCYDSSYYDKGSWWTTYWEY